MYRSIRSLVLVVMVLGIVCPRESYGQAVRLNKDKALTQYIHDVWQVDEGLPQNSVRAIAQTTDGYLWLGTDDGLARFDGLAFEVFDKSNVPAFGGGDGIRSLEADASGALWIGTSGSGLVKYENGAFTRVQSISAETISHVSFDSKGNMWVGSWDKGIFVVNSQQVTNYTTDHGLATDFVTAVHHDRVGRIWVGTRDGLYQFSEGRFVLFNENDRLSSPYVTSVASDTLGYVWVGTLDGIDRIFGESTAGIPPGLSLDSGVRSIYVDNAGIIWIGTAQDGLIRYDHRKFSAITTAGHLSTNRILTLAPDNEGSLWIGTEMGGLNRLRDAIFSSYSVLENLSSNMAYALIEGSDGAMWVGTDGGGLNRIAPDNSIRAYTEKDGLSSNIIMSLANSKDGGLWIGTMGGGLNKMHRGVFRQYTDSLRLPSPRIFALLEDAQGRLWIGTDEGLVSWYRGRQENYQVGDGLTSNFISTLRTGQDGSVWIGTAGGGISILKDGLFTAITTEDGLASNSVLDFHEDDSGDIWIATSSGLSLYRDGKITSVSSQDGLPLDYIQGIVEDHSGGLWFSSSGGIFTTKKRDFETFINGESPRIASARFGKSQGLKSTEMNGGFQPSIWKSTDGRLWFPSGAGVAVVNPSQTFHNTVPPPVVIGSVTVNGESMSGGETLTFEAGAERIDIHYSGLSYIEPRKMQFRYILNGYEIDWQNGGQSRTATYTNLDPGEYNFQVIAANSDGVWNYDGASISFEIKPFIYQTKWFYLLCGLVLFLVIYAGYRIRVRQHMLRHLELEKKVEQRTRDLRTEKEKTERQAKELEELGKFKTRFFANVSHEFRTPLTMIIGPLEDTLNGTYGNLAPAVERQLEIMHRNSLRLIHLINELLDLQKIEAGKLELRSQSGNLASFVGDVVLSSSALAYQKGIYLEFDDQSNDARVYFDTEKMEKVFYNILSNALKFTPDGGSVNVDINELESSETMPDGAVTVAISDTGPGIAEEDLARIFTRFTQAEGQPDKGFEGTGIGLALVKELVELHGGTISVESSVGLGTIFTVILPKGHQHLAGVVNFVEESGASSHVKKDSSSIRAELADAMSLPKPIDQGSKVPSKKYIEKAPMILVVDDNIDLCYYMSEVLSSKYVIAIAHNGEEGLAKARALRPDLIISDIQMPKMDGNELCSHVKADESLQDTPVLLLTAHSTNEKTIEGFERGADDYMSKPFNARELGARCKNLIELYSQRRALREVNDKLGDMVQEQLDVILEERDAYEKSLLEAKDRAEASERIKSTILDNISHEFRTPITVILGNLDIVAEEAPASMGPFIADIKLNSSRLLRTLDALLRFSEIQSRALELQVHEFDLRATVVILSERHKAQALAKGLDFNVEIPDEPLDIEADSEAITYALDQIVDNAVKFTRDGSVTVRVMEDNESVVVEVTDSGIGIAAEFMPQMFNAFSQESSGTTRNYEGTGLGLALAKRLLDQINAEIEVNSEPGKGSTFRVMLGVKSQQPVESESDQG